MKFDEFIRIASGCERGHIITDGMRDANLNLTCICNMAAKIQDAIVEGEDTVVHITALAIRLGALYDRLTKKGIEINLENEDGIFYAGDDEGYPTANEIATATYRAASKAMEVVNDMTMLFTPNDRMYSIIEITSGLCVEIMHYCFTYIQSLGIPLESAIKNAIATVYVKRAECITQYERERLLLERGGKLGA